MSAAAHTPLATVAPGHVGTWNAMGFQAVRTAGTDGRHAFGGSGDRHMAYDRLRLIHQSRQFARDNGIYRGMIDRAVGYIVGKGFTLECLSKDKEFKAAAEQLWKEFWKRPEIRGTQSGAMLERMVARETLVCGDTGGILTDTGLLQWIEAEQIAGKGDGYRTDGIVRDGLGRPLSYWVSPYGKGGIIDRRRARKIRPADFLFVCEPERPSSSRGVPVCQASFAMLHRINDVCDSEAIAWQLLARLAMSITREDAGRHAWDSSKPNPNNSDQVRIQEMGYALLFHGGPGDEIKAIERNIPGKDFGASLTMFLRLLGQPLGLPLEIVLMDWTKSNYSQSRAVLEQAYQTFQLRQDLQRTAFLSPVYEWKIREWIAAGLLADVEDAFAHSWIAPTFPWLDKLKEAQAHAAQLDRSMVTLAEVCKSQNKDPESVLDAREREICNAIDRAKKIKADTGVEVPWQIFAGLEVPEAKTDDAAGGDDDDPAGTPTKRENDE